MDLLNNSIDNSPLINREFIQNIAKKSTDYFIEDQRKEIKKQYKDGDLTDFADTMCVIWFIALLIYFLIAVGIKKSLLISDISECKRDARLAKESKTYVDELIPKVNQLVKECKELSELLKNDPRRILTEDLLEKQEESKQYTK